MHRQTVRVKLPDLPQRIFHIFRRLPRQSGNQIHIDILKAEFPGQTKRLHHILHCMPSSYQIQCLLLHGLRID